MPCVLKCFLIDGIKGLSVNFNQEFSANKGIFIDFSGTTTHTQHMVDLREGHPPRWGGCIFSWHRAPESWCFFFYKKVPQNKNFQLPIANFPAHEFPDRGPQRTEKSTMAHDVPPFWQGEGVDWGLGRPPGLKTLGGA